MGVELKQLLCCAGNQVVQQLSRMMPPPLELKLTLLGEPPPSFCVVMSAIWGWPMSTETVALRAGQRPGGHVELEITLSRTTMQPAPDSAHALGASGGTRSDAQLIAGTLHDDALLVCLLHAVHAVGAVRKPTDMK